MDLIKNYKLKLNQISTVSFLFFLIPFALITGPFLADLLVTILGIYYLYVCYKKKIFLFFENIFTKLFVIFYIVCIISSLYSENFLFSLESSIFYIRFLFFCLAVVFLVKNNNNFYLHFYYSLIITILILVVDAYFQFFFKTNLIGLKLIQTTDSILQVNTYRLSGFFGNELILGSFISRLNFILIGLYFHLNFYKKKLNNFFFFTFLILQVLIIFITGERLAFLIQIFCFIYILTLIPKIRKIIILGLMIITFLLIVILYFDSSLKNRMINSAFFFTYNNKTLSDYSPPEKFIIYTPDHHELYVASFKMFLDKPFFGHGYKMFRFVCKENKYHRSISSCSTHPHNIFLQFAAEMGLVGLSFLFIVYYYLARSYIYLFKSKILSKKVFKIFLLSIISANLFPLFPSGNFSSNWISIVYYLPISLYLSMVLKSKNLSIK